MTPRIQQLQQLASSLPGANQQVATGLQEAHKTQVQQAIKGMQPTQANPSAIQQMGAQVYQQQAAPALASQQQTQTQQNSIGQLQLQNQGRENRQQVAEQSIQLGKEQLQMADKLHQYNKQLGNKLIDNQLKFKTDNAGQELLNVRQLADFAITKARSSEDLQNYAQSINQASTRQLKMLQVLTAKLDQALEQGYIKKNKPLDQALKLEISEMKRRAQEDERKAQNKAKNNSLIVKGLGMAAAAGLMYASGGTAPAIMAAANVGGAGADMFSGLTN